MAKRQVCRERPPWRSGSTKSRGYANSPNGTAQRPFPTVHDEVAPETSALRPAGPPHQQSPR
jgi:hypothetical protein